MDYGGWVRIDTDRLTSCVDALLRESDVGWGALACLDLEDGASRAAVS